MNLTTSLGDQTLRTPLVAASGTVGSVVEWAEVADVSSYGAATAKSVAPVAWPGRPAPRMTPTEAGMINGIGIQNPGIDAWVEEIGPELGTIGVPVWGSAVAHSIEGFAAVAKGLQEAGVTAIEVNLSCPNLEGTGMFALDPVASRDVISAVSETVNLPVGAKLSPNSVDIAEIADVVATAGADWVTLTNTVWGAAIDIEARRPKISGVVGGYSGVALKPISLRCVIEVHRSHPGLPILGLGGVRTGADVVEYLMAGASAVGIGTAHFESPKAGKRVLAEFVRWCGRHGVSSVDELVGVGIEEI